MKRKTKSRPKIKTKPKLKWKRLVINSGEILDRAGVKSIVESINAAMASPRIAKFSMPSNHGKPWMAEDYVALHRLMLKKCSVYEIANALGRTQYAIFCQLMKQINPHTGTTLLNESNVYGVMAEIVRDQAK